MAASTFPLSSLRAGIGSTIVAETGAKAYGVAGTGVVSESSTAGGASTMASTAGQMTQTPTGNPQWRAANGAIVWGWQPPVPPQTVRPHAGTSYGNYKDWVLRMGFNRTMGIAGFWVKLPRDPGATWFVAVTDDTSDTPSGVTNDANHPPAGVK